MLGDTSANSFLLIGLAVLGAATGCALLAKLRKSFNLQELSLSGLIAVCVLSWAIALLLPAGSYLLFWPLMLTTTGFVVLGLLKTSSPRAQLLGTLPGAITAVLLFAPFAYLLYVFLTLNLLSIAAIGLLLGFFFILCVPLVNVATPQPRWRIIVLPLVAIAGVCLGVGVVQSHPSAQHPRRDSLLYSVNVDDHTAAWVSDDRGLDAYTAQFLPAGAIKRQPVPNFLAGSQRPVLSGPASAVALQPPVVEVKANEQEGDLHQVRMNVRSQRSADRVVLRFEQGVNLTSVKISGRIVPPSPNSIGPLVLYGTENEGVNVEFTASAHSAISFWLADYSSGLPTTRQRPSALIPAQGSDETVVSRKYTLGSQAK